MAVPWTNRDQTVFAPLNDYVATFIGMVRDDVAFNTALSADLTYTVSGVDAGRFGDQQRALRERRDQRPQPLRRADADHAVVGARASRPRPPRASSPRAPPRKRSSSTAPTARCSASRMMNHMCRDMEQVHDTSLPPDRIRQDVSRSPGGDSRIFLNNCIGCHSGMDPFAQAFAYYDFDNGSAEAPGTMRLVYNSAAVHPKYFNNDTNFAPGFITPDDAWENRWRKGQNSLLGWGATARQRQRRQVHGRGARQQRRIRSVPGREGVQDGVLPRAGQRRRSRRRSPTMTDQLQDQRLPAETGLRRNRCVLHGRLRKHT